jgi:hypothetical protein
MRLTLKWLVVLQLLFCPVVLLAQVKPVSEWTFNNRGTIPNKCPVTRINGLSGDAIDLQNKVCLFTTSGLPRNKKSSITVEFWFKGDKFQFLSVGKHYFLLQLNIKSLLFRTTQQNDNGDTLTQDLLIPLNGTGPGSYSYYTDQQWHHFVFIADLEKGIKQIFIDAVSPIGFSSTILKNKPLLLSNDDGFRNSSAIDELRFYAAAINKTEVQKRFQLAGKKIQQQVRTSSSAVDTAEFAPGYPNYTIQAKDQLGFFPSPRHYSKFPLNRNMSWMDINYLHRELPGVGGKGFGSSRPQVAIEIMDLLVKKWNYYIDIPLLRTTPVLAAKAYGDTGHLAGALVHYANFQPQYPVALISFQAQNVPAHFGMNSKLPFLRSADLPAEYFMRDSKGKFILRNNRKIHSPLMPLDIVEKDAMLSANYIKALMKFLKREPALINENGELFGHTIKEELLQQDPLVWKDFKRSKLSAAAYSGRFQFSQDALYKKTILEAAGFKNTRFSFYNLSAAQAAYWPAYAQRRTLNKWSDSSFLPSPDFYPSSPETWWQADGARNGFGIIAEGRKKEIELGDRSFAPFVSAGWSAEETTIRPAQWLALTKAMVLLGADFFYVGYFNITGKGGKWPNGAGPNDPRGYIYQAAMPVYAQALRSWAPDFFSKGNLLDPKQYSDPRFAFRFKGNADNELILVRKYQQSYLIYGSIQPSSNQPGNVPAQVITSIELDGQTVRFPIRRQGSIYILNLSGSSPVFYQLDGWHQYEHPYFWKKNMQVEAAVFFGSTGAVNIVTKNAKGFDFTNAATVVQLKTGASVQYDGCTLAEGSYLLKAAISTQTPGTRIEFFLPETGLRKQLTLSVGQHELTELNFQINKSINLVQWTVLDGAAELSFFSFDKN